MGVTKKCERCSEKYTAGRRDAKYCEGCRPAANRENVRAHYVAKPLRANPHQLTCRECGEGYASLRITSIRCPRCRTSNDGVRQRRYEASKRQPCPDCGGPKGRGAVRCHPCDNKSRVGKHEGAANPNWRGGKTTTSGYTYVRNSDRTDKRKYRAEHVLIWERANGPVPKGWHVHHVNGDKTDNRLENLKAMSASHHHTKRCDVHEDRIKELEQRIRDLESLINPSSPFAGDEA